MGILHRHLQKSYLLFGCCFENIQGGSSGFEHIQGGSSSFEHIQGGSSGFENIQGGSSGFENIQCGLSRFGNIQGGFHNLFARTLACTYACSSGFWK